MVHPSISPSPSTSTSTWCTQVRCPNALVQISWHCTWMLPAGYRCTQCAPVHKHQYTPKCKKKTVHQCSPTRAPACTSTSAVFPVFAFVFPTSNLIVLVPTWMNLYFLTWLDNIYISCQSRHYIQTLKGKLWQFCRHQAKTEVRQGLQLNFSLMSQPDRVG